MTKNEERIRTFFEVDTNEDRLRAFFESVNTVLQDNDGGFDENVIEITNQMISRSMGFEGNPRGKDEHGFPVYNPVDESETYNFCAGIDYAQKILNDEAYTIEQLQDEITRDVDEGNNDMDWEIDAGYSYPNI